MSGLFLSWYFLADDTLNHLEYLLIRDTSTDMIDMIMSIGDVAK